MTGESRHPVAELVLKRHKDELAARPALREGSALQAIGKSTLMALDRRKAEILRVPELCKDKFVHVVKSCVLLGKSANGPTKKRMKFFTAARNSNTATKKEYGSTAAQKSLKIQRDVAKELHKALHNLQEDYGSAGKEKVEKSVLGIGTVLPQALANVEGEHDVAVSPSVVLHGECIYKAHTPLVWLSPQVLILPQSLLHEK